MHNVVFVSPFENRPQRIGVCFLWEAAKRETKEETGLDVELQDITIEGVTNDFFKESGKHYVTIHLSAKKFKGIAQVLEPEKCAEWRWFELNNLPENLFLPAAQFLIKNNFFRIDHI